MRKSLDCLAGHMVHYKTSTHILTGNRSGVLTRRRLDCSIVVYFPSPKAVTRFLNQPCNDQLDSATGASFGSSTETCGGP